MISSAAGAMAVLMISLVKDHGLQYLLAASVLTGVLQYIAGHMKFSYVLKFVSRSVTTGFVNALAILIFLAQIPAFQGAGMQMYIMVGYGLFIMYIFPMVTKAIPSSLISIIVVTSISLLIDVDFKTIGDMGELTSSFPMLMIPDIPFNFETLKIIFPYSITLAMVGLLETLMTSVIIDDLTDTDSDKNRECRGQGIANVIAGFFGGMAGCALIGQSVINVKSGGKSRLSTLFAGCFLIFLILVSGEVVKKIPIAALVAVMIMVSISTFDWSSIKDFKSRPMTSNLVIFTTVFVVVMTNNLAQGVAVGILLSVIFFAYKAAYSFAVKSDLLSCKNKRVYKISGQIFFASSSSFISVFDYKENISVVIIDLSNAHFWDIYAVEALESIKEKLKKNGIEVEVIGLNYASETIIGKALNKSM